MADERATIQIAADLKQWLADLARMESGFSAAISRMQSIVGAANTDELSAELDEAREDAQKLGFEMVETGEKISGSLAGASQGADQAGKATQRFRDDVQDLGDKSKNTKQSLEGLKDAAKLLASAFAVRAVFRFGQDALETKIRLDNLRFTMLAVADGDVRKASEEFQFASQVAIDLGISLEAAVGSYAKFRASAKESSLTLEDQRHIYLSVSKAATVLGLSASDTRLAFLALEQIMSKGRVSTEDLRRQLAERIPGAMQLAAIGIGKTTAELDQMLRTGELVAEDLIPGLADAFDGAFGPGVEAAVKSTRAELQRVGNTVTLLKDQFATGFADALVESLGVLSERTGEFNELARATGETLGQLLLAGAKAAQLLGGVMTVAVGGASTAFYLLADAVLQVVQGLVALVPGAERARQSIADIRSAVEFGLSALQDFTNNGLADIEEGARGAASALGGVVDAVEGGSDAMKGQAADAKAAAEALRLKAEAADEASRADAQLSKIMVELRERIGATTVQLDREIESLIRVRQELVDQDAPIEAFVRLGEEARKLVARATEVGKEVPAALKAIAKEALAGVESLQSFRDKLVEIKDDVVESANDIARALDKAFGKGDFDVEQETEAYKEWRKELAKLQDEFERLRGKEAEGLLSTEENERLFEITRELFLLRDKEPVQFEESAAAAQKAYDIQIRLGKQVEDVIDNAREAIRRAKEEYGLFGNTGLRTAELILSNLELQRNNFGLTSDDLRQFAIRFEEQMLQVSKAAGVSFSSIVEGTKESIEASEGAGNAVKSFGDEIAGAERNASKLSLEIQALRDAAKLSFESAAQDGERFKEVLQDLLETLEKINKEQAKVGEG